MLRDISFYIKLLLLTLLFIGNSNSVELSIIPLKKPILDKITKQSKLDQGIIRPKSKPIKIVEKQKLSEVIVKPESKPSKQSKEIVLKIIEKKVKKVYIYSEIKIKMSITGTDSQPGSASGGGSSMFIPLEANIGVRIPLDY